MFWKKNKPKVEVEVTLTVFLNDGSKTIISDTYSKNIDYIKKHYNGVSFIRRFYKWYFGRPQSKHYQLTASNGEWTIRREQINKILVNFQTNQPQEI